MQCGGTTSTTGNYYVIVDGNLTKVKTGNNVPATGGSVQAWAWYNVNYNMKGTGGNDLTVNIGTNRLEYTEWSSDYYDLAGDVVRTNWHDQSGSTTWNSGFGWMTSLKTNTAYQPGIEYYYQTANLTTAAIASISMHSGYQFVYKGFFDVPAPPGK